MPSCDKRKPSAETSPVVPLTETVKVLLQEEMKDFREEMGSHFVDVETSFESLHAEFSKFSMEKSRYDSERYVGPDQYPDPDDMEHEAGNIIKDNGPVRSRYQTNLRERARDHQFSSMAFKSGAVKGCKFLDVANDDLTFMRVVHRRLPSLEETERQNFMSFARQVGPY